MSVSVYEIFFTPTIQGRRVRFLGVRIRRVYPVYGVRKALQTKGDIRACPSPENLEIYGLENAISGGHFNKQIRRKMQ